MPFPTPLTSPHKATLRTSGYWSRVLVALCPNDVVFRAQASQSITTMPFITFTWDSADVGAFGDVFEGMVCYISETTNIRDAKYRGRVRLAPSSTEFYIDLNATILNEDDYIIVIRDVDLFARIRQDTLIDGSVVYHDLSPQLKDHPNTIVLYDADNDGVCEYTPVQTGIPVDAAATVVDTWLWDTSGDGVVTIDDDTAEHPNFTFTAGYHYLLRVRYGDDNGQANYQISHVYAINRTFTAPVVQSVIAGSISGSTDSGWTANLTAYAEVSTLIDRTHCAVWHVQRFGDNSSSPIYSNVLMSGRIRSDSIQTEGNAEAGVLQQVSFTVEGLTAYLQRLKIPNDIIRAKASPAEWGEIAEPNPYRMAAYAAWAYTTLTNIASFGVEDGAFGAWQIGGEPRAIDGGTALDTFTGILDPIKAALNYAPGGEIFLARTASYVEDRSSLVTITTFELQDTRSYTVERDSSRTYAQVIAFGGVLNTTLNTFVIYSAQAPSIIYGDGGDSREITREILVTDSDAIDAGEELGLRASNDFAYNNPKDALSIVLFDSYAGVLIPTNYQRWTVSYPASSNTLGIAYPSTRFWQLQSVTLTINGDGSIETSGDFPAETSLDNAQVIAGELPINVENPMPVLPVLPNDLAFPTDPLELYPTDTPTVDDYQPIDPFSGMVAYSPMPPDVAGEAAARVGNAGCQTVRANFRASANATGPKVTVLGDPYTISVQGTTVYSTDQWTYTGDFTASNEGFAPEPTVEYGVWTNGVGWETTDAFKINFDRRSVNILRTLAADMTYVSFVYDWTVGAIWDDPRAVAIEVNGSTTLLYDANYTDLTSGTNLTALWSGATTISDINFLTNSSVSSTPSYSGFALIKSFTMRGTGVSPFTGGSAIPLRADAFYVYNPDDPEFPVSPLSGTEGFFVDNAKYAGIPPYSPSHVYSGLPFTGTNNPPLVRMQFDDYAPKSNDFLFAEFCRA